MLNTADTNKANVDLPKDTVQALVVLNPVSGRARPDRVRKAIEQHFTKANWSYQIHETSANENTTEIVRGALQQGVNLVIAAGGDGTVSIVANALLNSDVPMGIIPAGTGNALAKELHIPLDPDEACVLLTGRHKMTKIDIMRAGEQIFLLHIGIGMYSQIIQNTSRSSKNRLGLLAYILPAIRQLLRPRTSNFTVTIDDQTRQWQASLVMLANIGSIGIQPFRWGRNIRPGDGYLNIGIVKAGTFVEYLNVLWYVFIGRQDRASTLSYLTATRAVSVQADQPLPLQGDGEIIGERSVQIEFIPRAVQVIAPANEGKVDNAKADIQPVESVKRNK